MLKGNIFLKHKFIRPLSKSICNNFVSYVFGFLPNFSSEGNQKIYSVHLIGTVLIIGILEYMERGLDPSIQIIKGL